MAKKSPLKSSLILLAVAAGVLALTWFVLKPQHEAREKNKDKAQLLWADVEREKVLEFKVDGPSGALHLKRKAEKADEWLVSGAKTFDADRGAVDGIVSTVLAAKKESVVGGAPSLKDLGLEPAKYKLSFGVVQPRELLIGEDTPVDYLVYAKWSDSQEVFLTSRSLRFGIDKKMSELRNKRVLSMALGDLSSIEIVATGADKLDRAHLSFRHADGQGWKVQSGAKDAKNAKAFTADSGELDRWFAAVSGTMAAGFASDDPKEKAQFGLTKPVGTITLTSKDGKTVSRWAFGTASEGTGKDRKAKYYLSAEGDDTTYEVSESFKDHFKVTVFRFRPKDVARFAKADVDGFVVSDGKDTLEVVKEGALWKAKGRVLKAESVEKAIDALAGLKVAEYVEPASAAAATLARPFRTVELRGQGKTLALLVFGKPQAGGRVAVRTESMESPGLATLDLVQSVPMTAEGYGAEAEAASPAAGSAPVPANASQPVTAAKGKKVKLEPTLSSPKEVKKLPASIVKPGHKYTAEITLEKGGKIVIEFAADKAPYTVSNFLNLARNKFYDGVLFHRVIKDFMAQGGDPEGKGYGGPGYKFEDERNDLSHERGVISMANAGPNTNGSQFFIVYKPQPHLNGKHTVFGKVTSGMEVVDGIRGGDAMKTVEVFEEAK
jgi:peptidyl-prolyl cis-trans isomerase B (cyclophilin B)